MYISCRVAIRVDIGNHLTTLVLEALRVASRVCNRHQISVCVVLEARHPIRGICDREQAAVAILQAGEQLFIPPGTPHTFWNAGDCELRFITDVRPPGQLQTYWETVFGLAEDSKVGKNGLPNLLQLAVVAPLADSYAPNIPVPVTRFMVKVLGGIGRYHALGT